MKPQIKYVKNGSQSRVWNVNWDDDQFNVVDEDQLNNIKQVCRSLGILTENVSNED